MATFMLNAQQLITEIKDEKIQIRTKEVGKLYDDLMELSFVRQDALIGARKIHSFDRKIDETLDLIISRGKCSTIGSEVFKTQFMVDKKKTCEYSYVITIKNLDEETTQ